MLNPENRTHRTWIYLAVFTIAMLGIAACNKGDTRTIRVCIDGNNDQRCGSLSDTPIQDLPATIILADGKTIDTKTDEKGRVEYSPSDGQSAANVDLNALIARWNICTVSYLENPNTNTIDITPLERCDVTDF